MSINRLMFAVHGTVSTGYAQGVHFRHKKPPVGGFTTLLIVLITLIFPMVPGMGLELTQRERRGNLNSK